MPPVDAGNLRITRLTRFGSPYRDSTESDLGLKNRFCSRNGALTAAPCLRMVQRRTGKGARMAGHALEHAIEELWERRDTLSPRSGGEAREVVEAAPDALDSGLARVAEPSADGWRVNQWLKKAVLLSFRLTDSAPMPGPGGADVYDKVPMKFAGWGPNRFREAGFRVVPGAVVRRSAHVAPGVVLMPCFVNAGAYVDRNTMIDTWSTVGSCAQIGANCHISGGVGIGGVLEPPQAQPVIVEDGAFVGSRCVLVEGVRVEREAVLGAGVVLTASTPIIDVRSREPLTTRGCVPARAVVIPGSVPKQFAAGEYATPCALIVGERNASTDRKTSLNAALRDYELAV